MQRTFSTYLFVLVVSGLAGCSTEKEPGRPPLVDIPALVGLNPVEVDSILGDPLEVTKITNDPELMPGEYRTYDVGGSEHGLVIRFHDEAAVVLTLHLPQAEPSAERALGRAGIDVSGKAPSVRAPGATRWSGTFGGVYFRDVSAQTDFKPGSSNYVIVQARSE